MYRIIRNNAGEIMELDYEYGAKLERGCLRPDGRVTNLQRRRQAVQS